MSLYLVGTDILGAQVARPVKPLRQKPGIVPPVKPPIKPPGQLSAKAGIEMQQLRRQAQQAVAKARASGQRAIAAAKAARIRARKVANPQKRARILKKADAAEAAGKRALGARTTVLGDSAFKLPTFEGFSVGALRQMLQEALALSREADNKTQDVTNETDGPPTDGPPTDGPPSEEETSPPEEEPPAEEPPPPPPPPPPAEEPQPLEIPKDAKVRSLAIEPKPAESAVSGKTLAIAAGVLVAGFVAYRAFKR